MRTTMVGAYPVPAWLCAFPSREAADDALLAVLKTQELAGIDVVCDGGLSRWDIGLSDSTGTIDDFLRPLDGIELRLTRERRAAWRARPEHRFRAAPSGAVTGPIGPGTLDLPAAYQRVRARTTWPVKFTVASPYMLATSLLDEHYDSLAMLVDALADVLAEQVQEIDADVVQVDEAHIAGRPADARLAARGINRVLQAVRREKAVHVCLGGRSDGAAPAGTLARLAEFLESLEADHVVLEMARRPDEELFALAELDFDLRLGIGVIDVQDQEVESPDEVARRIEEAARVLSPERIAYVHPDCGLAALPRFVADAKIRALVEGTRRFLE